MAPITDEEELLSSSLQPRHLQVHRGSRCSWQDRYKALYVSLLVARPAYVTYGGVGQPYQLQVSAADLINQSIRQMQKQYL